jgi:hypothetical protein
MAHDSYSFPITRRDLDHARRALRQTLGDAHRGGHKGMQGAVQSLVRGGEVGLSAFAFGFLNGRFGPITIPGAPWLGIDALAGVGLKAIAAFGFAGDMGEHVDAFGDGALASYLGTLGTGLGAAVRAKAGQPPVGASAPAPDMSMAAPPAAAPAPKAAKAAAPAALPAPAPADDGSGVKGYGNSGKSARMGTVFGAYGNSGKTRMGTVFGAAPAPGEHHHRTGPHTHPTHHLSPAELAALAHAVR